MATQTGIAKGLSTTVKVVLLPLNSRTKTVYTATTSGTNSLGATAITVDALVGSGLYAGDTLTFGAQTVTLTADVSIGATSLPVVALTAAITAATSATYYGWKTLSSADSADLSYSGKTVDVSTFGDGLYTENAKIQIDNSVKISGVYVGTNPAIKEVISVAANSVREIAFVITDEKGITNEGSALVESYNEMQKYRDVKKFDFSLKVQGPITTKDSAGAVIS
jgi:hypothetical protein